MGKYVNFSSCSFSKENPLNTSNTLFFDTLCLLVVGFIYILSFHLSVIYIYIYIYTRCISFLTFFVWAFEIAVYSWKFSMLLLYILWDDWPNFRISGSNKQLQQQLEYTLLKPDCHSWWISKMQSDTLEEWYAIKFCFKLGKDATDCFSTILRESSISFWVAWEIQGSQGISEGWWEVWEE